MRTLPLLASTAALGAMFLTPHSAGQTNFSKLFAFSSQPDGWNPGGVVSGPNGALYGATAYGGDDINYFGNGTVFELQPPTEPGGTWTETVIHTFANETVYFPLVTPVFGPNGALYGMTGFGGTGGGSVYQLQPPSSPGEVWTEIEIYNFPGSSQGFGVAKTALLMGENGTLFGATYNGGAYAQGLIFQLTPPASSGGNWTETDLYSFTGASDGSGPEALVSINGIVYGATYGGGDFGAGTVFQLRPPAPGGSDPWTENVLYSFTGGADGSNPWQGSLTASNGILYGTTFYGGASGAGTVFQLQPPAVPGGACTETVLYSFGEGHGYGPNSPLIVRNGNIFGTASLMVTGDPILGSRGSGGMVFWLQPPAAPGGAWTEVIMHHFDNDDIPYGSLFMDQNGALYASALDGNAPDADGFLYKVVH